MQLTLAERLVLRNQLVLMKALNVPDHTPSEYDEQIAILDRGYEVLYSDVLHGMSEQGTDPAVVKETFDILDMFRALHDAGKRGLNLTGGTSSPTFDGFDANNDDHYGVSIFLLNTRGSYAESAPAKNSHTSSTLARYRRMFSTWQGHGAPYALDQTQVDDILA